MPKPTQPMTFDDIAHAVEVAVDGKNTYLVEGLNLAIAEAAKKAKEAGGKSEVSLKLGLAFVNGRIHISAAIARKLPEPKTLAIAAYLDKFGRLVSDDPQQEVLPFEAVAEN